ASRRIRIWSAACSTGQEAYSIAMTVVGRVPQLAGWDIAIKGTDLSTTVLEQARSGRYSQLEVNRGLPAPLLIRHFDRTGAEWTVKQELRAMTTFTPMNLARAWPAETFDVLFLRNVLIYFDKDTKSEILARAHRALSPDGYLFLGAAETLLAAPA